MNPRHIATVFNKELLDSLRDRRTLISMIAIPVLVMPVLILGMGYLTSKTVQSARQARSDIMVLGAAQSPQITRALEALENISLVPATPDYTNLISTKRLRAAVQLPDDFDAALDRGEPANVSIFVYEGEMKSGMAAQTLSRFFQKYRDQVIQKRLADRNLPPAMIQPFNVKRLNVAPPQQVAGNLVGGLLPYMVILLCMIGGMYPAMDLTAGEKERGTMETILTSPVARINLVLGKYLMVLTAAIITAILSLGSMTVTYLVAKKAAAGLIPSGSESMALTIDPLSVLAVFGMILPVAFFLSALQLAVSLYARSFKEAQTYLSPLMIIVIVPAMASMTPGLELDFTLALIPILNTSLVCKDIMSGTSQGSMVALIFFSNWIYGALSLALAVKLFNKESVLLRT